MFIDAVNFGDLVCLRQDFIRYPLKGSNSTLTNRGLDDQKECPRKECNDDAEYDHPLPYDTSAPTGEDFNSTYDEANPHIGDEYSAKDTRVEGALDDLGMHIDNGDIVELDPEDEFLSKTPEDDRPDLDEEGYPINDAPPMP